MKVGLLEVDILQSSDQDCISVQSGINIRPIRNLHLFRDKACHFRLKSLLHDTVRVGGGNSVADAIGDDPKIPYNYVSECSPSGHKRKSFGYVLIEAVFGLMV